jgi:PhoPQ-activated pathogenicity-related protein
MPVLRTLALLLLAAVAHAADYTALDRYVAAPDPSYRYTLVRTTSVQDATVYQLDMVSQTWLTTAEVDRPEWHHWVTIVKPDQLTTSTAILVIDGGSNTSSPSTPNTALLLQAVIVGAVVVDVGQVPNQPLRFTGEDFSRSEDGIIAYTWDKFLRSGDERWPARLPMTKAAVRAMDTATDFLANLPASPVTLTHFIVAGGSKRGWATWSTAAVDPRVIAIAPVVIDTLNVPECFMNHWRSYGFWAPAVEDYANAGIMNWFGTPQMDALMQIEDPNTYRDRLALPTFQLNSTGDQFFVPDSPRFYFADLPGEKYLRFAPNSDHGSAVNVAATDLLAWFVAILQNHPRPRFSWHTDRAQGRLTVRTVNTPSKVLLWQATNPNARDFRLESLGPAWTSSPLTAENGVVYEVTMPPPAAGYTAFFVELTFPGPVNSLPLVFTTEVVIAPDGYPFDAPPLPAAATSQSRRDALRLATGPLR